MSHTTIHAIQAVDSTTYHNVSYIRTGKGKDTNLFTNFPVYILNTIDLG